jgi:hypothetical protein
MFLIHQNEQDIIAGGRRVRGDDGRGRGAGLHPRRIARHHASGQQVRAKKTRPRRNDSAPGRF